MSPHGRHQWSPIVKVHPISGGRRRATIVKSYRATRGRYKCELSNSIFAQIPLPREFAGRYLLSRRGTMTDAESLREAITQYEQQVQNCFHKETT